MDLMRIPGVGTSLARELHELGYTNVDDLRGKNPDAMYEELCARRGFQLDRCVLYVFRCATYFAETDEPEPEMLKWWNWKDATLPPK